MPSIHTIISGRVQGVSYRAWCAKKAMALGLDGWVRNRSDGTVEAVFAGEQPILDAMVDACHHGPLMARVEAVAVSEYTEIVAAGFMRRETV